MRQYIMKVVIEYITLDRRKIIDYLEEKEVCL